MHFLLGLGALLLSLVSVLILLGVALAIIACVGLSISLPFRKVKAKKQQRAQDFLWWLYSSETGKSFVIEKLNFIPAFDTFNEDERPSDPLSSALMDWMSREGISTLPWDFTIFPSQAFKEDFGSALLQYAQGTMTWDQVKALFVRRWQEESA